MQRLGFCKALVLEAPRLRSGTALASALQELVESRYPAPLDDDLLECLDKRFVTRARNADAERGFEVSLQDFYICHHPSKSGWLSSLGPKEYTEGLLRYLGLVDDRYRVTHLGEVLARGLISPEEAEAFRSVRTDINPLTLTRSQQVYFLYVLLAQDGDLLVPFIAALLRAFGTSTFSYLDAGEALPELLRDLLNRFAGAAYNRAEREQLRQLDSALSAVEEAISGRLEKQGSGSRREQTTIPRLEWLIDLGLADKAPSAEMGRRYRLTEEGCSFASDFTVLYEEYLRKKYPEEGMATLLDQDFFGLAQKLYSGEKPSKLADVDILDYLRAAYQILSGVSGYCVVRPLLLLANALRVHEGHSLVEYSDALVALEEAYRADAQRVYYTVTRDGSDFQLRLGG